MKHESKAERLRRHAEYERASNSPFNRKANEIVEKLRAAEAEIGELLEAHEEGCECDFCRCTTAAIPDHVAEDLKGLAWSLSISLGAIEMGILPTPEMKAKYQTDFLAERQAKK